MLIRTAKADDCERIAAMHVKSITHFCQSHYSEEQINVWTESLKPSIYASAISEKTFLVAESGQGKILGIGIMDIDTSEICAVYIDHKHSRCKIGSKLLSEMEAIACKSNIDKINVKSTLNAQAFYMKKGYRPHGTATHSLPNGIELECIPMDKRLTRTE